MGGMEIVPVQGLEVGRSGIRQVRLPPYPANRPSCFRILMMNLSLSMALLRDLLRTLEAKCGQAKSPEADKPGSYWRMLFDSSGRHRRA